MLKRRKASGQKTIATPSGAIAVLSNICLQIEKSKTLCIVGPSVLWKDHQSFDIVVLIHLYFDHMGDTELFRNARFDVQACQIPCLLAHQDFDFFPSGVVAQNLIDQ